MVYEKKDFDNDCEWLHSQGVETHEREDFILSLIREGFQMTKKEYVRLMDSIN